MRDEYGEGGNPGDSLTIAELDRVLREVAGGMLAARLTAEALETKNAEQKKRKEKTAQELNDTKIIERFNIIGMDSCLMSMGEVMFAISDYADYFVGAEGFEPQAGWPYRQILEAFLPGIGIGVPDEPAEVAKTIVSTYIDYYQPLTEMADWSVDLAACRLTQQGANPGVGPVREKLENLAKALLPPFMSDAAASLDAPRERAENAWNAMEDESVDTPAYENAWDAYLTAIEAYRQAIEAEIKRYRQETRDPVDEAGAYKRRIHDKVLLAHWKAQSYKNEEYVDLGDFCDRLTDELSDGTPAQSSQSSGNTREILAACRDLKQAIHSAVVRCCFSGPVYQHSRGISLYFPWSDTADEYAVSGERWDFAEWGPVPPALCANNGETLLPG